MGNVDERLIKIGQKIKELRHKANLNQEDLLEAAKITRATLSSIENGGETSVSTLLNVIEAINRHLPEPVTVADVFESKLSALEAWAIVGQRLKEKVSSPVNPLIELVEQIPFAERGTIVQILETHLRNRAKQSKNRSGLKSS